MSWLIEGAHDGTGGMSYAYPIGSFGPYISGQKGGTGNGTAVTAKLAKGGLKHWT